jgi:hypothetical protein
MLLFGVEKLASLLIHIIQHIVIHDPFHPFPQSIRVEGLTLLLWHICACQLSSFVTCLRDLVGSRLANLLIERESAFEVI